MATVAELRFDVDSRSVKGAVNDLDRLENQSEKTERAAEGLGRSADKTGRKVGEFGDKAEKSGRRVGGLEKAVGGITGRLGLMAAGLAAAGAALTASFGAKSLKDFSQFEAGFSKVETLFDETSFKAGGLEANVAKLRSGLLQLRADSGDSFDNLNKGLFDLVSAGVAAEDSLRVLNDANTLAKAGATDVAVAVDGLTTALNAYQISADKSEAIASKFFTTQKFGKTTVEDIAKGLGQVAPLAAQLGVSLDELLASQAAATSAGIRQTEAYTGLKAALTNIVKPTGDAIKEAERLGIQFDTAGLKAKGLTQFLADVKNSAEFTDESFQRLFGSAEALNFILAVTGGGAGVYAKTLRELSDETKSVATLQEAYGKVLNDTDEQFKRFKGTLGAISVAIGAGLAPAFGDLIEKVNTFLRGDDFANRLQGITDGVAGAVSVLADNWGLVETGVTAAATALAVYLALNMANAVATTLNLAGAWRSVEKAVKGAAAATALLGAASGATGLRALVAGAAGFVATLGRAVFSVAGLRTALLGLGRVASVFGGPIAFGIVTAITAIVTFRKEIGNAINSVKTFSAQSIAGTDKLGVAFRAVSNVLGDRLKPLIDSVSQALGNFKTGAIEALSGALEGISEKLSRIGAFANVVGAALADLIPQQAIDAAKALADKLGEAVGHLDRLSGFKLVRQTFGEANRQIGQIVDEFLTDVREEADRIENAPLLRAANDNQQRFNNQQNADLGFAPGLSSELEGLAGGYNHLAGAVDKYEASTKAATQTGKKHVAEMGGIERSLKEQVTLAKSLAEAAEDGGASAVEFIQKQADIAKTVDDLFAKSQEAGESLTRGQIDALVRQIDGFNISRDKLIEAEKATLEAISKTRNAIADNLDKTIDDFIGDVNGINFADPRNSGALEAFATRFEGILADFDIESIGLDENDVSALEKKLQEAGVYFGEKASDDLRDAADYFADRVQNSLNNILDDLLFNGGKGLGDAFRNAVRGATNEGFLGPLSKFLSGNSELGLGETLKKGFSDFTDKFAKAGEGIAKSISGSLAGIGKALGGALGGALAGFGAGKGVADLLGLGQGSTGRRAGIGAATGAGVGAGIGSVVPGIGTAIGAAVGAVLGTIAGALSGLFGRKTASGQVNLATGATANFADSKKDVRNDRRDQILAGALEAINAIAAASGGSINPGVSLLVNAGKKDISTGLVDTATGKALTPLSRAAEDDIAGATRKAVLLGIKGAIVGADTELLDFAEGAINAGQSLEQILPVLSAIANASATGTKALSDFAIAAAKAGLNADQITAGVNSIGAALALGEKPLSNIAQAIKNVDDAINPAIASLKAVGQSFAEIAQIGKDALRSVGVSFIDGIKDLNLRLKNDTLADYKGVLDEIAERQNDAFKLFERGAITQGEFDLVQSTGGLQAANFFKTLSQDEKDKLADYLGILGEVSGDIAVARARLEEQFDYLIDNVEDTARGFEEAAANFERLGKGLRDTAENIRVQFSGLTPRANVDELLGRVSALRNEGLAGNASALEALPQVVTALVNAARQAFGGTGEFARIRDIGLAALDETAAFSEALAKQNFEAAENARTDVELLADIRNLIDDDRQLTTLQGILDSGQLTNKLIEAQLQSFIDLFGQGGQPANQITAEQLQEAATQAILEQQRLNNEAASATTQSTVTNPAQSANAAANDTQVAQAIADNATALDRQAGAINSMSGAVDDLVAEQRRLTTYLQAR